MQCYDRVSAPQAILGLFFQLSRYKQQQKQAMPASPARQGLSSIPGNTEVTMFIQVSSITSSALIFNQFNWNS